MITLTHLLDREPSYLCSTEAMMAKHYANTELVLNHANILYSTSGGTEKHSML